MNEIVFVKKALVLGSIIWFISLILAPLTLPPNSIRLGDNGRANTIDYLDEWQKLPLYQRIVYILGDLGCHQKSSRSLFINGNQMPVCSRCFGVFTGLAIALPLLYVLEEKYNKIYVSLMNKLFSKHKRLWFIVYFLSTIPLLIDFFTQFIGLRESNNFIRFTTALPFTISNTILFYHYLLENNK
ncbi:DUF2085 domain-containing protein [Desulfurococcaceae archaeon MEX13E-LK6-19]|nr:DUF2085 domain-containing protein [Desulfurococcaceae archaeon MEX13E-LK6-19]